ncbi:beta-lactamase regulating signal transducer with metallopeptidase domain [Winogradskyella pacifica]|uniref:Beta-lactamase regulating signal transducer with metallopeptidase domain n=1 Tax=Winogradskyella pacifica TaxID=664642 RepID=A0A3D9N377_9FLAO|nr:M56 family metallopeptidase [Winogradskyella pacifica]REE27248.1 beta-lactamase regulating signal transducer with metallopeptidase domain [Winogradskyella pacifica]
MEYLLKASAVIAIMYVCFYFFLKKETFFEHNRWFLLTGLVLALIFPLIVIPVYIPVEPIANEVTTFISSTPSSFVTTPTEVAFDWFKLIPILYSIGIIVFSVQFVFQLGSLVLLLLKNPKHKDQHFTYVIVDTKISPFSFFKWIVYNPESYDAEELQLILTHEKVHVNQLHSIDIICTQLACILFWFNPLIWLYKKEVRQNLEYIADSKTQSLTNTTKEYQHLLLKTSVTNHATIVSNNFYNSSIKKRILMLNKSRSNKKNLFKYLLILPLLAGLLMSMNTETVYVEVKNDIIKNTNTTEIIDAISTESIKVKFTKNMSDESLYKMKTWLKSKNVTMTIKHVKRNRNSEISNLNIDFKTENGTTNYHVKDKDGIAPFEFKMDDDGSFGVEVVQPNDHKNTTFIIEDSIYFNTQTPEYKTKISQLSFNKDTIHSSMDSLEIKSQINKKSDFYYEDGSKPKIISQEVIIHDPSNKAIYNSRYDSQNPKPLIIVNGKPALSSYLKTIDPNDIESMTVLKGENAIDTYGDKGKNGVIELVLKDSKAIKKDSQWKVSKAEISNVTFIDDEDASKNGSIAYISKSTPDQILDSHVNELKRIGITVKYSKLKRNKAGEITSIKISLEDGKGSKSSAAWKVTDGIPNIEFGKSEGTLIARTQE